MKSGMYFSAVAALALSGCQELSTVPEGYSDQFIVLPSGLKACCNRQGYREVRVAYGKELVTTTAGDFVECDARVGPPGDELRTDEHGNLLTPDQIAAVLHQRDVEQVRAQNAEMQKRQAEQSRLDEKRQSRLLAEQATQAALDAAAQAAQAQEDTRIAQARAACKAPYEQANARYLEQGSAETGMIAARESTRMNRCLMELE